MVSGKIILFIPVLNKREYKVVANDMDSLISKLIVEIVFLCSLNSVLEIH